MRARLLPLLVQDLESRQIQGGALDLRLETLQPSTNHGKPSHITCLLAHVTHGCSEIVFLPRLLHGSQVLWRYITRPGGQIFHKESQIINPASSPPLCNSKFHARYSRISCQTSITAVAAGDFGRVHWPPLSPLYRFKFFCSSFTYTQIFFSLPARNQNHCRIRTRPWLFNLPPN